MAEVLSRNLNLLGLRLSFKRYRTSSGCPIVTHLAYADDILLFSSRDKRAVRSIDLVLKRYERISGQRINTSKSSIFVHDSSSATHNGNLSSIMGFEARNPLSLT